MNRHATLLKSNGEIAFIIPDEEYFTDAELKRILQGEYDFTDPGAERVYVYNKRGGDMEINPMAEIVFNPDSDVVYIQQLRTYQPTDSNVGKIQFLGDVLVVDEDMLFFNIDFDDAD